MNTSTSLVLKNDIHLNNLLQTECARVANLGGTFTIEQKWHECNWFTKYMIYYPESYKK